MTLINNSYIGWTPPITAAEKLRNQIETVRELAAENPDNEFWRNRLAELEAAQTEVEQK